MVKSFENAKWIWINADGNKDEYGEFFATFSAKKASCKCRISCDGDYTLFINGKFVASNQYGDFEHYKIYDEIEIGEWLNDGENHFYALVWHFGEHSQRYIASPAGVIFECEQDDEICLRSGENISCRQSRAYRSGYEKKITYQLGYSFLYDATRENDGELYPATVVKKECNIYPRPTEKLRLLSKKEITVLKNEGNYYLIDLGEETVGLPTLEFFSPSEQKILVAWGEDLQGGHVRQIIGNRDFSFEYVSKKGHNVYTNFMLRLGCRYMELYSSEPIELRYLGLIPQEYPVEVISQKLTNELDQRIYETCVRTLKLSIMEHYVDTPWREQCLYAFDSRNQMLCGYYAFRNGNGAYARANLKLMSEDRRNDGLLSICFPCGMDLTIPTFSLYYFVAVKEYIEYTGDVTIVSEIYPKLISIIETFINNRRNGLVCKFSGKNHWNFYDWSEHLDGKLFHPDSDEPDLIINCLFIIALESLRFILDKAEKPFSYDALIDETRKNVRNKFFNANQQAYGLSVGGNEFTTLGNSLAVIAKVEKEPSALCEKIANGQFSDCSLSMKCFKYDALLSDDKLKWRDKVLDEIRNDYKKMIDAGATSVWETIDGASAFGNAGSLCHGWSAIPVYYFHALKLV